MLCRLWQYGPHPPRLHVSRTYILMTVMLARSTVHRWLSGAPPRPVCLPAKRLARPDQPQIRGQVA